MWILIITLLSSDGSAMTSAEFYTESACNKAGDEWSKQTGANAFRTRNYLCVSKGDK